MSFFFWKHNTCHAPIQQAQQMNEHWKKYHQFIHKPQKASKVLATFEFDRVVKKKKQKKTMCSNGNVGDES